MRAFRLLALALLAAACGKPPPPKIAPPPAEPPPPRRPALVVRQELGDIDEGELKKTFATLDAPLQACFDRGRKRLPALQGDARVYLRVGEDGRLAYAFYEQTTLGDRATEVCALEAFRAATWPKPRGGEAEVRHDFGLDASTRAQSDWNGEGAGEALARAKKVRAAVDKCRAGVEGTFRVTAHLKPAKKKRARIFAAGAAAPSREGEARVDCLLGALEKLELEGTARGTPKIELSL